MRHIIAILLFSISNSAFSCGIPSAKYESVSETHWNYELVVNGSEIVLHFDTYWYNEAGERKELKTIEKGECFKTGNEHLLKFKEKNIKVMFKHKLSHKPFGQTGASPGVIGDFFQEGYSIELWNFIK